MAKSKVQKVRFKDLSFCLKAVIVWGYATLGLYCLGLVAILAGLA